MVAVTALGGAGQFTLFAYFAPYYRQVLHAEPATISLLFMWFGAFGLLGNLLLIAGFIFLILRGLTIALEASTLFSRLLAGAVTLIFFTYAFVNMGMVSGILPVVGVPLPFISYGGDRKSVV